MYKIDDSEIWIQLTILQFEVYHDPGKELGKSNFRFCQEYNSYSFHNHKILNILNVLSIYVNDRKIVEKNVHRGRTHEQIS